mgnify:CR=1 FL=1
MQNYVKSQTRLAFVQYIFQKEFLKDETEISIEEFQTHFYNSNIAAINDKKEFKLKFNKNFLNKLNNSFADIDKKIILKDINNFNKIDRNFENWNNVLKSLIFGFISEIKITESKKISIVFNDYLNISKSLLSSKETKLMNAILQKYLDKYEFKN